MVTSNRNDQIKAHTVWRFHDHQITSLGARHSRLIDEPKHFKFRKIKDIASTCFVDFVLHPACHQNLPAIFDHYNRVANRFWVDPVYNAIAYLVRSHWPSVDGKNVLIPNHRLLVQIHFRA